MFRLPPTFPGRQLAAWMLLAGIAMAQEPLKRIAEIRELPRERAAEAVPVLVRGVVTWRSGADNLTVQDDSAGIWVDVVGARKRDLWRGNSSVLRRLREGMEVEIAGRSDPGGYAPLILPESLRILGAKELPDARRMEPARFFSGADDCQRIEVRGVVQGVHPAHHGVTLVMNADPGRFIAQLDSDVIADPALLVDAEVSLRGVAASHFNTRGELTISRVLAGIPGDLRVEKPPPAPEDVPRVTLDRLLPFRAGPIGPHRVRVEGTVTHALPGRYLYVQEGTSAVRVETSSPEEFMPGDRVEAAGFVTISRLIGTLVDASVRKTGTGTVPEPVSIAPAEILDLNRIAVETAQVARPHDYDGHLIRCRARLLAVQSEPDDDSPRALTLEQPDGSLVFRALFHERDRARLAALRPGSELEVTGLVQLDYVPNDLPPRISRTVPASLDLILRGPGDVVVLSQPPWWTAKRLAAVLAAVLLALGGALVWSLQLKRQVLRKTQQLAVEMRARRDASVEFQATLRERTRLAANLHDTLLQTMSGLGFQIDACEAEATAPRADGSRLPGHLDVARRMLNHALDELRNSVWALRSLPLNGMAFPEALDVVVQRLGDGRDTRIDVRADGDLTRVPDFIAGNLLLVVQEALHNALKHGDPRSVTIDVRTLDDPPRIALTVRDDGAGFTPGTQSGVSQGHFGLQGMRERLERLDGSLGIQSAPGQGTTVHAEAPLRNYDRDLADRPIDSPSARN